MRYLDYLDTPEGSAIARLRWGVASSAEWRVAGLTDAAEPPVPFHAFAERHGWPGLKVELQKLGEGGPMTGAADLNCGKFTCAECGRVYGPGEAYNPETLRFCWWS